MLEAIAPQRDAELEAALARLGAAGIVFPEGRGQERTYSFKHALVRDAAYESLLLSRRRDWHERIARVLEERFPETAANEPEVLAHHFGAAGLPFPHQINLTFGRRAKRLHQHPACGGRGSGG